MFRVYIYKTQIIRVDKPDRCGSTAYTVSPYEFPSPHISTLCRIKLIQLRADGGC